mgnify:CR=1 FL=1
MKGKREADNNFNFKSEKLDELRSRVDAAFDEHGDEAWEQIKGIFAHPKRLILTVLAAVLLVGAGFEVINLGVNITADRFVEAVRTEQADILCLSALLTTTMNYMKTVIEAVEQAGLRDRVKIMVGGAPVNQLFADQIGADGYSDNANSAVLKAKELIAKSA